MKVLELINILETMPDTAEVHLHYDGALRIDNVCTWFTRDGVAAIGGRDEPVYYTEDRPAHAPDSATDPYWSTNNVRP